MKEQFPNIPFGPEAKRTSTLLQEVLARNPDLQKRFREQTAHLLPELTGLLRKRDTAPESITQADIDRMTALVESFTAILKKLIETPKES